jgi:hydrogenase expression/formation protein HypC
MLMARVEFPGGVREVCLECVPEAQPGDWVLVHLGLALEQVDEATARETRATAEQITGC